MRPDIAGIAFERAAADGFGLAIGAAMFAAHGLSDGTPMWDTARLLARAVLAWTAILGLLGFAQLRLHHDGPVRRYLTEAIFPYYIAHQTIIVAAGFWLKQAGAQPELAFGAILLTTMFGCALTYEIARRVNWLRPLLGLKASPIAARPAN
jgi:glucans biosynthesis protein C